MSSLQQDLEAEARTPGLGKSILWMETWEHQDVPRQQQLGQLWWVVFCAGELLLLLLLLLGLLLLLCLEI